MRSDIAARCSVRRPGWLRHPAIPAESCCLPTLTRFTSGRCAGPGHRTQHRDGNDAQVSGSPVPAPYTTRTAHSTRSMTPCGTLESRRDLRLPRDPTTIRSAPSSAATRVIASTGSDCTGCVWTRTGASDASSRNSCQERFDRLAAEGGDDVDGPARRAGQLRSPTHGTGPGLGIRGADHDVVKHAPWLRPPSPAARGLGRAGSPSLGAWRPGHGPPFVSAPSSRGCWWPRSTAPGRCD